MVPLMVPRWIQIRVTSYQLVGSLRLGGLLDAHLEVNNSWVNIQMIYERLIRQLTWCVPG